MSKNNKHNKKKLDPNVQDFLDEMETINKTKKEELKEGEYVICPGCGEKISKKKGVCEACGVKVRTWSYTPISDKKAAIIRWSVGVVMVVGFFLVWFLVLN